MTSILIITVLSALCSMQSADGGIWTAVTNRFFDKRSPVIFVPGLGGQKFEMKVDKKIAVQNEWCKKHTKDYENVWVDLTRFMPKMLDCFADNLKMNYNKTDHRTYNQPGVMTRPGQFGSVSSVENIVKYVPFFRYATPLVYALKTIGYRRDVDIKAATYDFRRGPNDNPEWMADMEKLVEETFSANGNRRVTIIGHSLGGVYSLYFLNHQSQEWKDKYVSYFIPMGAPFGGSYLALVAEMAHDLIDNYLPKEINWFRLFLKNIQTMSVAAALLPNQRAWGSKDPLVSFEDDGSKVTINDYEKVFKMINETEGLMMYYDAMEQEYGYTEMKHPGVNILCISGKGVPTIEGASFRSLDDFPHRPHRLKFGKGDGIVNQRSTRACSMFSKNTEMMKKYRFEESEYQIGHITMVYNPRILAKIVRTVARAG